MNNSKLPALLRQFAMPAVMVLLGAILLLNPDSAAVMIASVIAWILLGCSAFYGVSLLLGGKKHRTSQIITCAVCLILGTALLANPLLLAANLGRFLGLILAVEGFQNLLKHSVSKAMAILTLAGAAVLLMAPMTASRLVFSLCGLILLVIGAAQIWERLRRRQLKKGNDDSNIIDAL